MLATQSHVRPVMGQNEVADRAVRKHLVPSPIEQQPSPTKIELTAAQIELKARQIMQAHQQLCENFPRQMHDLATGNFRNSLAEFSQPSPRASLQPRPLQAISTNMM